VQLGSLHEVWGRRRRAQHASSVMDGLARDKVNAHLWRRGWSVRLVGLHQSDDWLCGW
jgi:hypothetical protein